MAATPFSPLPSLLGGKVSLFVSAHFLLSTKSPHSNMQTQVPKHITVTNRSVIGKNLIRELLYLLFPLFLCSNVCVCVSRRLQAVADTFPISHYNHAFITKASEVCVYVCVCTRTCVCVRDTFIHTVTNCVQAFSY